MTVKNDFSFFPSGQNECEICGITAFAHFHKAGTLPKDFEKLKDPMDGENLSLEELRVIDRIVELIKYRLERAVKDQKSTLSLGGMHNSYGAGADYGSRSTCETLLEDINDEFDLNDLVK